METDKTIKTSDGVSTLRTIITNHHGNVTHEHTQEVTPPDEKQHPLSNFDRFTYLTMFVITLLVTAGCVYTEYLIHTGAL